MGVCFRFGLFKNYPAPDLTWNFLQALLKENAVIFVAALILLGSKHLTIIYLPKIQYYDYYYPEPKYLIIGLLNPKP